MKPARKLGRGLGALMNIAPVEEDGSVAVDALRVAGSAPSVLQLSDEVAPSARTGPRPAGAWAQQTLPCMT